MKTIDKSKPVLVTGATGYIASWVIRELLAEGLQVHGTVRSLADTAKYAHLTDLAATLPGTLRLFEADLLRSGSFSEAVSGCSVVFHMASPFIIRGIKNADTELVRPALEGTRNVLSAVNDEKSVQRVVLTSSVVAIFGDACDIRKTAKGVFDESYWNTTSSTSHQPYNYSKVLAEREAWGICKSQDRWDMVTVNPGLVVGPSLSPRTDSTSIGLMVSLAGGEFKSGTPGGKIGVVDVRDVALAHVRAAFRAEASGRYLLVNTSISFLDMANRLRELFPDYPLPRKEVPRWLFWLIAPLAGFTRRYVARNVGIDLNFDNRRSREELGIEYRDLTQTLVEQCQQAIDRGLVKPAK